MIQDNLSKIKVSLPESVTVVVVSKYQSVEAIELLYRDSGQRIFGESRVQELTQKHKELPQDIKWHFIGHLQTNKVRSIIGFVDLIHSVDSLRLLDVISQEATKAQRIVDVLLQIHIAKEETKYGFSISELDELLKNNAFEQYSGVNIVGLMAMASLTDDREQIMEEFLTVKNFYDELRGGLLPNISVLSMGMSTDYPIAVECGANMVRIGSAIFSD